VMAQVFQPHLVLHILTLQTNAASE
jgi:hypothetical protein